MPTTNNDIAVMIPPWMIAAIMNLSTHVRPIFPTNITKSYHKEVLKSKLSSKSLIFCNNYFEFQKMELIFISYFYLEKVLESS